MITWALVASFPLDKQVQVNTISFCNMSAFLQVQHLLLRVVSDLILLLLFLFNFFQDENDGKDQDPG